MSRAVITTVEGARERGLTRAVYIEAGASAFAALIRPQADLDGCFSAFDTDNCEMLAINGWLCSVEDEGEPS